MKLRLMADRCASPGFPWLLCEEPSRTKQSWWEKDVGAEEVSHGIC